MVGQSSTAMPDTTTKAEDIRRVAMTMPHANTRSLAEVDKSMSAMLRSMAMPLAEVDKSMSAMLRSMAMPLAEVDKSMSAMLRSMAMPLAEVDKSMSAMLRSMAMPLAEVDKSMSAMLRSVAMPLAEVDKRMIAMHRANASPLAENVATAHRSHSASEFTGALASQKAGTISLALRCLQEYPAIRQTNAPPVGAEPSRQSVPRETRLDSGPAAVADAAVAEETRGRLVQFDIRVTDVGLHRACRRLFISGHYAEAVRMAFTYFDNMVREKSGQAEKDGADLMRFVFSAKKPLLKLNALKARSDLNEQEGYMHMFAGAMTGIRNPRSHEHDLVDDPDEALELLVMANHFMRRLNKATPI